MVENVQNPGQRQQLLNPSEQVLNPLEQLSLEQLRRRRSAKWQAFGPDALPLWVAEMDVPLAEPIQRTLTEAIQLGDTGYPTPRPFIEAMIEFASARWGWRPEPSEVRPVADVMHGIVHALDLVSSPGDTVIVSSPVYPPFFMYPASAGRSVVQAPLGTDGRLDFAALERSFSQYTQTSTSTTYLLCNPQNPTGAVHTRSELEQLAQLAARHGIRVIADEIHAPLVYSNAQFTPYLSVDPRGYSLMSASKAWNLAGLKAALLIAGPDAADELKRLPPEVSHSPSHFGVLAQTAAYAEGTDWLNALLDGLETNRDLLGRLLTEHLPQVGFRQPEGTYLAWLDFRALGYDGDPATPGVETPVSGPARFVLQKAGVALTPGHPFGSGGEGHARLNFAASPDTLRTAVAQIAMAQRSVD